MGEHDEHDPLFLPLAGRVGELASTIDSAGLGALVLTSPENVYYATGYTTTASAGNPILYALRNRLPSFAIVTAGGQVILGCWGFSVEGVEVAVDRIVPFNSRETALEALVREASAAASGRPLGLEASCPHVIAEQLVHAGARVAAGDQLVLASRLVKSDAETERLARSLEIAERSLLELLDGLEPGVSRVDLMRRAKHLLLGHGADGVGHVTFTFGHTNPEIAIDETLVPGDLVVLDLGGIVDGYHSDTRRYAHVGPVAPELRDLHAHMVEIVDAVGEALRPGAAYDDVYSFAMEQYAQRGVAPLERFTHVGHHIGLETEEDWIDRRPDTVREGMVIAVELYTLTANGRQIGNEETFVIGRDGSRRISTTSREIRSI